MGMAAGRVLRGIKYAARFFRMHPQYSTNYTSANYKSSN